MKKYLTFGGILIVALLTVLLTIPRSDTGTKPVKLTDSIPGGNTVRITEQGFMPNELTIKKGETVAFVNETESPSWPASDPHPTHTFYPETGGCINSTFDTCKSLGKGETFIFTFNKVGKWRYHDHRAPGSKGTIIVSE